MGSEVVIIAYSVLAFLSLYFYNALSKQEPVQSQTRSEDGSLVTAQSLPETKTDPLTFAFKFLFLAVFIISLLGIGKGVIEAYDYCYLIVDNSNVSGNLTDYAYDRQCFENTNTEDLAFFSMVFWIGGIVSLLVLLAMIWQIFLFVKNVVWPKMRGGFKR